MAGTILQLLPLTGFEWSKLGASISTSCVLRDYIDIDNWTEGQLLVRAHAGTGISSSATAVVTLTAIAPSPEDPSQAFVMGTLASATLSSSAAAGTLKMAALVIPVPMARLEIQLNQASSVPNTAVLYLSVDLVLKRDG